MTRPIDLRVIELLSARLCHDLIGPVAAISNGAELLADEEPEFVRDAVALVGDSARKASRRLQFYRFAYGFSGGGLAGLMPYQLAAEFFEDTAIECDYRAAVRALPLEQQKLACLMLALAGEGLPRGGRLALSAGAARRADPGCNQRRAYFAHGRRLFRRIARRGTRLPSCRHRSARRVSPGDRSPVTRLRP